MALNILNYSKSGVLVLFCSRTWDIEIGYHEFINLNEQLVHRSMRYNLRVFEINSNPNVVLGTACKTHISAVFTSMLFQK